MDEKYFVAKIQYDFPDENTGKIKKVREEKLVKGYSVTDVEAASFLTCQVGPQPDSPVSRKIHMDLS